MLPISILKKCSVALLAITNRYDGKIAWTNKFEDLKIIKLNLTQKPKLHNFIA